MCPHEWLKSDLSPAEKVTLWAILSLWNQCHARWVSSPTVENVAGIVGVHTETCRKHFVAIESAGFISRDRESIPGGGSRVVLTINLPDPVRPRFAYSPTKTLSSEPRESLGSEGSESLGSVEGSESLGSLKENTPEKNLNPKNDDDEGGKSPIAGRGNLEPFEMPVAVTLPKVASLPMRESPARREFVPVKVSPEMRDRIYTSLGVDGDEFARYLTQEMVDRDGFVDDVLRSAEKGQKRIALALSLLKRFGNWKSPEEKREADKKLREDVFWRKMGVSRP